MKTSNELSENCLSIALRLSNEKMLVCCKTIEELLEKDEDALACFCGVYKEYHPEELVLCVVTNKRIVVVGQRGEVVMKLPLTDVEEISSCIPQMFCGMLVIETKNNKKINLGMGCQDCECIAFDINYRLRELH